MGEISKSMYIGIDITELKSGDVITENKLRDLYRFNTDKDKRIKSDLYWSFCLNLKNNIERFHFNNGTPVVVRQKKGDFHVIQGNEMSEYCYERGEAGLKSLAKYSILMNLVDDSKMTNKDRKDHERRTVVMNEQLKSVLDSRNKLGLSNGLMLSAAQVAYDNDDLPSLTDNIYDIDIKVGCTVLVRRKVANNFWHSDMDESIGKTFRVEKIDANGKILLSNGYVYLRESLDIVNIDL